MRSVNVYFAAFMSKSSPGFESQIGTGGRVNSWWLQAPATNFIDSMSRPPLSGGFFVCAACERIPARSP